jgi:hypothetical protein
MGSLGFEGGDLMFFFNKIEYRTVLPNLKCADLANPFTETG